MRAYVTAAGMALGLVAVWAVLVPLVARGSEAWRTGARACGQGPCGAVSPATSRASETLHSAIQTYRTGGQTTAGRRCCRPCIPETAASLSRYV